MRFGIVAKPGLPKAIAASRAIIAFLRVQKGVSVDIESRLARALRTEGTRLSDMDEEVIITVGGDGTVLKALQEARGRIFAVNAGVLGFLTEVSVDDAIPGLKRVLRHNYVIEKRLRLRTVMGGRRLFDSTNEAVVHTSHTSKMRHYRISMSGVTVDDVRADGMIIATPTGSTCYSMSAGGPILDPAVGAFVIVPLAPFKMSARALVVPDDRTISVRLMDAKPSRLVLDGQFETAVPGTEVIEFSRSETPAEFIRFSSDFYANLKLKLQEDPFITK